MNENDIWLIAGLGNPEAKYDGTRHNAGFAALDALADKWNISVGKTKFQGQWGQGEVDGHSSEERRVGKECSTRAATEH